MNVPKGKDEYYICSVYSYDIADYPYIPFIAKTISNAICMYLYMSINEGSIKCPNAELHIIGTARVKNGHIVEFKPSKYIYRIDTDSLNAKTIYYTEQFKNRVRLALNRLRTSIYSYSRLFKKNLKQYIQVER